MIHDTWAKAFGMNSLNQVVLNTEVVIQSSTAPTGDINDLMSKCINSSGSLRVSVALS